MSHKKKITYVLTIDIILHSNPHQSNAQIIAIYSFQDCFILFWKKKGEDLLGATKKVVQILNCIFVAFPTKKTE